VGINRSKTALVDGESGCISAYKERERKGSFNNSMGWFSSCGISNYSADDGGVARFLRTLGLGTLSPGKKPSCHPPPSRFFPRKINPLLHKFIALDMSDFSTRPRRNGDTSEGGVFRKLNLGVQSDLSCQIAFII
jgi:hypothetical protein